MNWTNPVAYTLIGLWLISSIVMYRKAIKNYSSVNPYIFNSIPSVFTTLGILGTFLGIFFGLLNFDVHDIEGSIPQLLSGMKTAFLTSIFGIVLSLITSKFISYAVKKGETEGHYDSEEVQKLNELVIALKTSIDENQKNFLELKKAISSDNDDSLSTHFLKLRTIMGDEMSKMNKSLGGDSETSLLTQFQLMRDEQKTIGKENKESISEIKSTMSLNSKMFAEKFDEFSALLERSNTEALVKAIENVIGGFNDRLNELIERLVKENFEELNTSVQQLNSWQKENKEQVSLLIEQYKVTSNNLKISANTLNIVSNATKSLVEDEGRLSKLILELEQVMVENTMFKESVEKLNKSSNEMQTSSNTLNEWMVKEKKFAESVSNLIESLKEIEKLRDKSGEFWKDIKDNFTQNVDIVKQGSESLMKQVNSLENSFNERMTKSFMSLDKVLQAMVMEYHNRGKN